MRSYSKYQIAALIFSKIAKSIAGSKRKI
jgi:hypothetical protein